jgi:single-strand DNA-binding protein
MNYNKVILAGRLTRDPELKLSQGGMDICKFALAINKKRKDPEPDSTTFVDCTAFGKTGALIGKHLTKGEPILIEGRLDFQQWGGQSGKAQTKLEVIVDVFQFVGGRGDAVPRDEPTPSAPSAVPSAAPSASPIDDEDVPF